jgi:RNA polymerase sigma factor (sigma-70 family)
MTARLSGEEAAELVARAREGDRSAWDELVAAYDGLIWAIARNHRLTYGDACDVSQTTWLRLLENLARLHNPARVGAWLATTARRECLRLQGVTRRTVPLADWTDFERLAAGSSTDEPVDEQVLREERVEAVRRALAKLPRQWRVLMELLMVEPGLSYSEVSDRMGVPIGTIGPTRGRCLVRLRAQLDETLAPTG